MSVTPGNDLPSFGALLKGFRKRRRLTQKQLADALGMHRNAVGRWEKGDVLPASKTLVVELARHLHLDEAETRALLEASLTAVSLHWSVPLPRNPYFTGRDEVLGTLHLQLGRTQTAALTQSSALSGLGGVGKTQIALEYAYRHALDYSAVFWIGAETIESIISSLLRVAAVLQLPGRGDQDQQWMLAAVGHWLTTHHDWLMIWDNLEDFALLARFMPTGRWGAILITTRCQALGTRAHGINLDPMGQEEGVLLLLRRAKALEPNATLENVQQATRENAPLFAAAHQLVTELGRLPLAIDQAGAYIEETGCGVERCLQRYQEKRQVLLDRRGQSSDHPLSIVATLRVACQRVAEQQPAALELLRCCAFLYAETIPEELLLAGGDYLGPVLGPLVGDATEFDLALAILRRYSLVQRHPDTRTLSLHRLVQAVLLHEMSKAEREQWRGRIIQALDVAFPEILADTEYPAWKQCERLLPHTLWYTHRTEADDEKQSLAIASLDQKAAQYMRACGRYVEAEPLYQSALHIREQVLEANHPDVTTVVSGLAGLYRDQGRYGEAEWFYHWALRAWEQRLGPDHLQVAYTLASLASVYVQQGKYAEAEPLHQQALRIREQVLGPDHLQVAHSLNSLAVFYRYQGKYDQAAALFQRALHIREQVLGPEHPSVASPLYNLANLCQEQEHYEQAEPLFQRALQIWEQALGSEHPNVAYPLNGLAMVYSGQEHYEQAEPLFQRALKIWVQALGPEHPHLASPLQELANLYRKQGNDAEAEPLYQRALAIREQQLGEQHPGTAETLHNLALLRQQQGNLDEAQTLARRVLRIREAVLGDLHPLTLATRDLCAQLGQPQTGAGVEAAAGRCPEALPGQTSNEDQENGTVSLHSLVGTAPLAEDDPVQAFLDACCELDPLAWCRISSLWHAYTQWTACVRQALPLSRRAFTAQMKARGCRPDRTSTMRLWRGIRLQDTTR